MTDHTTERSSEAGERPMITSHPPTFPPPAYLSAIAQAALRRPRQETAWPERDDIARWERYIEGGDAIMRSMIEPHVPAFDHDVLNIDDVPVYRVMPQGIIQDTSAVFLDFHGGGLINGGGELTALASIRNAYAAQLTHWAVDYRMPPRHPYPAAIDDAEKVYRAAVAAFGADRVIVGGESAGGNIAAALILRAKRVGLPMPAGLVLLSPEIDLTESGDSFAVLKEASNSLGSLMDVNLLYADGADLGDPEVSPLFGDVDGFPPTLLQAGTRDLFLSNTVRMHRKLREVGVDADLHIFDAMPHSGFGGAPEDRGVMVEVGRFVKKHLSPHSGLTQGAHR